MNFHSKVIKYSDFPECGGKAEQLCRAVVLQDWPLKRKKTKTTVCMGFFQLLQCRRHRIYNCFFNQSHPRDLSFKTMPSWSLTLQHCYLLNDGNCRGLCLGSCFSVWCSGSDSVVVLFLFSTIPPQKKNHPEMTCLTAWALGTELSSFPQCSACHYLNVYVHCTFGDC